MFGGNLFGGVSYAGGDPDIPDQAEPIIAVELAFTTGALETPAWETITGDVRSWNVSRGRRRELERFQPGRATIVLDNRERQYDSNYSAGPHFGNLKPMRRIRIRETFNGVTYPTFDGFVDKWQLDYPATGKDATATIIATDGFKIPARTDLPSSVYAYEVDQDAPVAWWRLGNPADVTTSSDVIGDRHLAYIANPRSGDALVARDPNGSTLFEHPDEGSGNVAEAAHTMPFTAFPFSFEAVFRSSKQADNLFRRLIGLAGNESGGTATRWAEMSIRDDTVSDEGKLHFALTDDAGVTGSVTVGFTRVDDGATHHVAVVVDSSTFSTIYLDGVDDTSFDAAISVALPTGTVQIALGNIPANDPNVGEFGLDGELQDVAIYDYALGADRIAVHADAVHTPWNADQPDGRIVSVLDLADWPADLREIDAGNVALQSAEITGQTALEHMQKVATTEFGLLFMSRDGKVRLVDRAAQFSRQRQATFGDSKVTGGWTLGTSALGSGTILGAVKGQVAYRDVRFDDGDSVIRNRASIAPLNGPARVSEDADSVEEFGRFDYTQEGLLHDSLTYAAGYAAFIVAEYKDPRRRVVLLDLGPARDADVYEQMLGRELGERVRVQNHPPGGGDRFSQDCVIEGVEHNWSPKVRTARFILSPEFTNDF